ncbi:unnamed protein product [Blepharisma stoltei]|uniref:Uncharacterized protein n=1 Tax=Blepharisma stoltei TaxID=1481888 RepID=A0AAU9JIF6_9CILI|nr:unnamed protein product [Blepharisma stoltei]
MSLSIAGHGLNKPVIKNLDVKSETSYIPVPLEALKHPYLDDNPIFQELKRKLSAYYEHIAYSPQDKNNWESIFYSSLSALLNEIVYTRDKELQMELLNKVSKWSSEKLKERRNLTAKPSIRRPTYITENQDLTPISSSRKSTDSRTRTVVPELTARSLTPLSYSPKSSQMNDTKYMAFTYRSAVEEYPEVEKSLDRRYRIFRDRETREKQAILFKQMALSKWEKSKSRKEEEISSKLQQLDSSYKIIRDDNKKKAEISAKKRIYDFRKAVKTENSDDSQSEDGDEADEHYQIIEKIGKTRNQVARILPIELQPYRPKSIKNASLTMHFNKKQEQERYYRTPDRITSGQMTEAMAVKAKLAAQGILMPLKDIESGLISHDGQGKILLSSLPKGGENLLSNNFQNIDSKGRKVLRSK